MPKTTSKALTSDQVLDKMAKYCAYQERCVKDVKEKLKSFELVQEEKNKILNFLIDNRFVDEERFTKSFVRGKINQSGWGLNKIRFHLMQKGIAKETIDEALQSTDEETYRQRLIAILRQKSKSIKAENDFEKKRKLAAYAMQKGFEQALVWEVLKELEI